MDTAPSQPRRAPKHRFAGRFWFAFALVVACSFAAAGSALPAVADSTTGGFSCPSSLGTRTLGGPSNVNVAGEWSQGSAATNWLIGCSYPDPTGEWEFEVAWTPVSGTDNTFEGCGSTPINGTAGFVSSNHWAYASTNIDNPPGPLAGAAEAALSTVTSMAKGCVTASPASQVAPVKAAGTPSTTATSATPTPPIRATIVASSGEIEFRHGSSGAFTPLTAGVVLQRGDFVSTGFDSTVTLDLGYGLLAVGPITQLRLDEFVAPAHLGRTQVFLRVGTIAAKVKHVAAIRSDFSVTTPTASASIRGSEIYVAETTRGATNVYTVEDRSFVKGAADKSVLELKQGYMTTIGANRRASRPRRFSTTALFSHK